MDLGIYDTLMALWGPLKPPKCLLVGWMEMLKFRLLIMQNPSEPKLQTSGAEPVQIVKSL